MEFSVQNTWLEKYKEIHSASYQIDMVKPLPSKWIEENIVLPEGVSRYKGPFSYNLSPYVREIVDTLSGSHPARTVSIIKCAQIGLTQGLIIPGMAYTIAVDPAPMLFLAGDKQLAQTSIQERFDPIMHSSNLQHLIRPAVIRAKNQRTGDTSLSKEYAGGRLTIDGTNNADKLRQISVKTIFADDWDAAPRADKKEGSLRKLMEGRQTSYGNIAKTYFISTPTVKEVSNIEPVYLLGDQRKWHWNCPHCGKKITPEWRVELQDGTYAGIVWETNKDGDLIPETVKYKCPHCKGLISESMKYDLNLSGEWLPTAKPSIPNYYSYYLNALMIPPGFVTWVDLVKEWMEACPAGQPPKKDMLKTFLNIRMGITWEEQGETPKVTELMNNTRNYEIGVVPNETSEMDGNGKILFLSLACDLNGIMSRDVEDVRLDWEIKAHSAGGQTYSVIHGSIGTFQRIRDMSKSERNLERDRERWTYQHGQPNSVWLELEKIMRKEWPCETGEIMTVDLTVLDTGHFTNLVNKFIDSIKDLFIIGVKGKAEAEYRKVTKDTKIAQRSREKLNLYLLEVNQLKDIVADNMKLRVGMDGSQPEGFMNFPQPSRGLYNIRSYFSHFESERKIEDRKGDDVVGYKWEKIHSNVQNHFWDVHVYNIAAKEIYIDMLRRSDPKLKDMNWADFVGMVGG